MCCNIQPSNLGSSETTREAPLVNFDFSTYLQTAKPEHIQLHPLWLQWFIGFSEANGYFLVSKRKLCFSIDLKEIALLYNIRTQLGFGKITLYTRHGQTYGRYDVHCKKNCLRLATLFNGNLVLQTTSKEFGQWLEILHIPKLKKKPRVDLTSAWLSGFINGKGCFFARIRKNSRLKLGYQFIQKFTITLTDELDTLEIIQKLFCSHSKVKVIKNYSSSTSICYKLEISSAKSNDKLLNYLSNYPNFGQKQVIIKVYQRLNGYVQRQEHLTEIGLRKIVKLSNQLKKHTLTV